MQFSALAVFSALAALIGVVPAIPAAAQTGADGAFMVQAADGGITEVQLGRLATQRAGDPAVRDFGQRMVVDHGRANTELIQIARQQGVALPNDMSPEHRALYDRLAVMSGPDFDRAYMRTMVDDHTKDVADFQREAQTGRDPMVRAWAARTLPVLQEHLRLAQTIESRVAGLPATPGAASPSTTVIVTRPAPTAPWCGGAYDPRMGTNLASCPR
jgi:putative membrane protein